jgi:hypothetical protein
MSLYFSIFCIQLGFLDLLRESLGKNELLHWSTQGFPEATNKTIIETVREEIQHLLESCKQNECTFYDLSRNIADSLNKKLNTEVLVTIGADKYVAIYGNGPLLATIFNLGPLQVSIMFYKAIK